MTQLEITTAFIKFANQDLSIARRRGIMAVTETKKGNLQLEYDGEAKTYTISNFNNTNTVYLAGAKKAEAMAFLMENYTVEA